MGITLQIKRTTGNNAPGTLANGELAYSHGAATQGNNGKRLFVGDAANSVTVIGGQYFTDMLDHPLGTLTASSAIITDATSKVDTIKLKGANNQTPGNIVFDDNDGSHTTTLKGGNSLTNNLDISLPDTLASNVGTVITTGNLDNITEVGTLSTLDVDNVNINGNTITATGNLVLDANGTGVTISASNKRITQVATPQNGSDATNKSYVDGLVQGLDVKGSVRAATTAHGTLSTAFANGQTVGGVTVATGDRILIKDQQTGSESENGVYTVNASGAPSRASDFDSSAGITAGAFVFVEEGSNADQGFVLTNNGTINIGTTALAFSQFSGAGNITAGFGLDKTGSQLLVKLDGGAASGLAISNSGTKIAAGGVTAAMMAASSVDLTTNTVTGALPLANGGTGLTSIAKGSVLVSNNGTSITALDGVVEVGSGNNTADDKFLLYNGTADTLGFTNSLDGGTYT